ncbi:MAG: response regulator [Phormidesmis sp.]
MTVPSDTIKVLLLEDDPTDVELLTTTLSNGGLDCTFVVVETRREFQSVLETQPIDIVLADYSLPAFDGLSAIELVKARFPEIPCVLVSGILGEDRAVEALKSGATDYVLKQRSQRLMPAIKRALREREERQALAKATADLKASEARFRTSVETMADCLMLLESVRDSAGAIQDLAVSYLNEAACNYLSVTQDDQIGKSLYAVVPAFKTMAGNTIGGAASQGLKEGTRKGFDLVNNPDLFLSFCGVIENDTSFAKEVTISGHQGAAQFVVIDIRAAKLEDGLVLTWRDVTEQKQGEQRRLHLLAETERAKNQAEQANQFKDIFLANLSHELRSPLSAIIGWLEISGERLDNPTLVAKAIDTSCRNAKLLNHLIGDLIDVSRITQGGFFCDLKPLAIDSLFEIITDAIDTHSLAAQKSNIQITFSPKFSPRQLASQSSPSADQPAVQIMGDAARLQQVIGNLLSNAVKFTPAKGQVNIDVEMLPNAVAISVKDTGRGISSNVLPHVFEPFWQTDETLYGSPGDHRQGLRLGLSIAHYIVEAHGGKVTAESDGFGAGSRFCVSLPLASKLALLAATSSELEPAKRNQPDKDSPFAASETTESKTTASGTTALSATLLEGYRVLVVEDYQDGLDVYMFMLEAYGATVRGARSADVALEIFHQFRPDVVVSDIDLPNKSGHELIREIRTFPADEGGDVPAIALTAFSGPTHRTQALLAGFQQHIVKPIELQELAAAVASISQLSQS